MNRKNIGVIIPILIVVELSFLFLTCVSYANKEVDKIQEVNEIDKQTFAMYIENDNGKYDEVPDTSTFPEGYILNLEMTSCVDNKGNSVSDILTSKDDKVMVKSNKTVFCYLYFDEDNRVFAQVKRDYKNSNGALLLSETESDEYPVYYYNGNITNNNILYANFCWKMVRTTETGGVKLIYNGVPDESEDGTLTCDNTGEESQIGTSTFNPNYNSPAYLGYMYNSVYSVSSKGTINTNIISYASRPGTYYYGDSATWDGSKYVLSNGDGNELKTYTWSDNYTNLLNKYTCHNSNTSCSSVSYVTGASSTIMYYYNLESGKSYNDYKIKLSAEEPIDNGDGTYTLVNPIEVLKADWYTNYSNYKNYYYCGDLISEVCSDMYYVSSTSNRMIKGFLKEIYKYGNSFTYEDGIYKLVDTKEFWNWPENYNQINNHHYTCFNTSGECEKVSYIYYTAAENAQYITLSNGKSVEDALNEMLYAEDVNKSNSTIKLKIDTWYEDNIIDVLDSNNLIYSSYLEDTIWCNNREITDLGGWNPNGGDTADWLYFNYNSLECINKTDQFTLKIEKGGTEGYGNNTLDYPIGLISYKEAGLASIGYLKNENSYWVSSAYRFSNSAADGWQITLKNNLYYLNTGSSNAVRPSVSLSNKVEITGGNGSVESPYQIILPS